MKSSKLIMTSQKSIIFLITLFFASLASLAFCANKDKNLIEPQILVIFGSTGDLSQKKLFPALNQLYLKNELPEQFACVGLGRSDLSDKEFREKVLKNGEALSDQVFYIQTDVNKDEDFNHLKLSLEKLEDRLQTKGNRIFYLATAASHFPTIVQKLKEHGLIYDDAKEKTKWSKVIIEKPFGRDYTSALELKDLITKYLDESQTYLIDHYLGKEVIQNILPFRFLNPTIESLWNKDHIESVHITLSEEIGIGDRGVIWEETGLLRDLVQNHAMQIVSLIAMEKPLTDSSEAIHKEKIQVLKAIQPFPLDQLENWVIRGQYGRGIIQGKPVLGYREEKHVPTDSNVETFTAVRLKIDMPRWEGVPFYIKAGKRLKEKRTEVVIRFKSSENALIFRIQPNEEIAFAFNSPITSEPAKMAFNYRDHFKESLPEAYELLLKQCMLGDKKFCISFEESLISWKLYTPVLKYWESHQPDNFPNYSAGSNGPELDLYSAFSS